MKRLTASIIGSFGSILYFGSVSILHAQDSYVPMAPIPGYIEEGVEISSLGGYLQSIFQFAIAAIVVMAVIFVTYGGFLYLTAGDSQQKVDEGKKRIQGAVGGLLLAAASFVILNTLNPQLLNFEFTGAGPGGGSGGGGNTSPPPVRLDLPFQQKNVNWGDTLTVNLDQYTTGCNGNCSFQVDTPINNTTDNATISGDTLTISADVTSFNRDYRVHLEAIRGSETGGDSFMLNVQSPPTLTLANSVNVAVSPDAPGGSYRASLAAAGGGSPDDITFVVDGRDVPDNTDIQLNSTYPTIKLTTNTVGGERLLEIGGTVPGDKLGDTVSIPVQAENRSIGTSTPTRSYTLQLGSTTPLQFGSVNFPDGSMSDPYVEEIPVSGGAGNYSYDVIHISGDRLIGDLGISPSITSGGPDELRGNRTTNGHPSAAGTSTFKIRVTDDNNNVATSSEQTIQIRPSTTQASFDTTSTSTTVDYSQNVNISLTTSNATPQSEYSIDIKAKNFTDASGNAISQSEAPDMYNVDPSVNRDMNFIDNVSAPNFYAIPPLTDNAGSRVPEGVYEYVLSLKHNGAEIDTARVTINVQP